MSSEVATSLPDQIREVFSQSECLYSKAEIEAALDNMATEISYQLSNANPIFICVVVGGMVPLGNLLPRLAFPLEVDYAHATRYRGECVGKDIHWKAKPSANMQGRTVVVVDDILDGGLTLADVVAYCRAQGASDVKTAALVNKRRVREPGGVESADFVGLHIDDDFVFGYGLDYKEYLRNAPGIYRVPKALQ